MSKLNPHTDIYSLVQVPEEDFVFPRIAFEMLCLQLRTILFDLSKNQNLIYPMELEGAIEDVISKGIAALGIFHINRILLVDEFGRLLSEDFIGLAFYANKMAVLELDDTIDWSSIQWNVDRF